MLPHHHGGQDRGESPDLAGAGGQAPEAGTAAARGKGLLARADLAEWFCLFAFVVLVLFQCNL